jgi:hypothetical protein
VSALWVSISVDQSHQTDRNQLFASLNEHVRVFLEHKLQLRLTSYAYTVCVARDPGLQSKSCASGHFLPFGNGLGRVEWGRVGWSRKGRLDEWRYLTCT